MPRIMRNTLYALALAGGLLAAAPSMPAGQAVPTADRKDWIQLFNGKDLADWSIKFAHHDLGENYNDTFRVEDGLLKVRYDKWTTFNGDFGHIFYKQPFSYYLLAAEYRFVGDQAAPAATPALSWAKRNNGLMLHCLDPKTMLKDQSFPVSIEVQLLGGLSDGKPRTTANLCTPGTNVVMNGKLHTPHCTNSTSKTYDGDQWVRVEVLVHGDELIRHMIDGQTVLEYSKPQIGGGGADPADPKVKVDGTILTGGFISLQAETAPADFRKVELLNLEGCMDAKAKNYKKYFVKANPSACQY
jgi:3-keto-disaccharide hydrolase